VPTTAPGERIYAIGDVHGCVAELNELYRMILDHEGSRPPVPRTHILFLGDIVDRGPDSRGALEWIDRLRRERPGVSSLFGNHEEMLIRACDRDALSLGGWLRNGGDEAVASFGLSPFDGDDIGGFIERLRAAMSPEWIEWVRRWPLTATSGDYFFCHAGVRPGVALRKQQRRDLLWIREEFLDDPRDHGAMIVHGHTVSPRVELMGNRIGVDTGAYRTGVLSAVCLDGAKVDVLATSPSSKPARTEAERNATLP